MLYLSTSSRVVSILSLLLFNLRKMQDVLHFLSITTDNWNFRLPAIKMWLIQQFS